MASPPPKRHKVTPILPSSSPFSPLLLSASSTDALALTYAASTPYQHAVIPQLFNPDFLNKARDEIVSHVSFRDKETDIYKISQTGDLTNLSGLPSSELSLLPTLLSLRDSLYSLEFRTFLSEITGCGPLSGIKMDMSCADYSKGSYLLNHDDVIGTRRVSFILYLVKQEEGWVKEWGGALELYPVLAGDPNQPTRPNVPASQPTVSIPPAFNQFAFFAVQPGHSFHSVEEVVVESDGVKGGVGTRLSLSGWFHKPVEGELGYEEEDKEKIPKSSLEQLYATTLLPPTPYAVHASLPLPLFPPTADLEALKKFINPSYFHPSTITHLRQSFIETSQLVLGTFLHPHLARELESLLRERDDALNTDRRGVVVHGRKVDKIPPHDAGTSSSDPASSGWELVGPPHIQRFCSLSPSAASPNRLRELLQSLTTFLSSSPFRTFLHALTSLLCQSYTIQARRFRPGLDYTLARGEPASGEARLDVNLGLTPVEKSETGVEMWEEGECGGWEIWLAGEEEGEETDEATYGGGAQKKQMGQEEEEDGPLLALRPQWNTLVLVLRDAGVMRFKKYLSAAAPGSVWEVGGEWEIEGVEEVEEEGGGENAEGQGEKE